MCVNNVLFFLFKLKMYLLKIYIRLNVLIYFKYKFLNILLLLLKLQYFSVVYFQNLATQASQDNPHSLQFTYRREHHTEERRNSDMHLNMSLTSSCSHNLVTESITTPVIC